MRLLTRLAVLTCALLPIGFVHAGSVSPYTPAAHAQVSAAGTPLLIEVHADWCPTCRAQAPVVAQLVNDPRYAAYTVLVVDYDAQKDVRAALKVSRQSTLLVFKGGHEVDRAIGITSAEDIGALLDKAL
ncbi:MAG: thioredoxin family protein [Nevskia sp.]|uniref:thioredoxin family protein n=1 Tax=Nevskia sp. TaxID=1929292 RepID=UPI00403558E2